MISHDICNQNIEKSLRDTIDSIESTFSRLLEKDVLVITLKNIPLLTWFSISNFQENKENLELIQNPNNLEEFKKASNYYTKLDGFNLVKLIKSKDRYTLILINKNYFKNNPINFYGFQTKYFSRVNILKSDDIVYFTITLFNSFKLTIVLKDIVCRYPVLEYNKRLLNILRNIEYEQITINTDMVLLIGALGYPLNSLVPNNKKYFSFNSLMHNIDPLNTFLKEDILIGYKEPDNNKLICDGFDVDTSYPSINEYKYTTNSDFMFKERLLYRINPLMGDDNLVPYLQFNRYETILNKNNKSMFLLADLTIKYRNIQFTKIRKCRIRIELPIFLFTYSFVYNHDFQRSRYFINIHRTSNKSFLIDVERSCHLETENHLFQMYKNNKKHLRSDIYGSIQFKTACQCSQEYVNDKVIFYNRELFKEFYVTVHFKCE